MFEISRCLTSETLMILSRVLIRWEVRETGRKLIGDALEPPLWIGMIKAVFKTSGMLPVEKIRKNIIARGSAILYLHFFRRMEGIPSGQGAALFESCQVLL